MDSESEYDDSSLSSLSDDDEIYEVPISQRIYSEEKPKVVRKYENDMDNLANIYMSADSDNEEEDRLADYSNDEFDEVDIAAQKKCTPKKDYKWRSGRWSPKIQSVCHVSPDSPEIKREIDNLVLVKEDEIKQEEEFLNEDDDQDHSRNDFQKSIFAEYPNLKIKDEFNFTSCSIKLEKMDFSHISSTSFSEPDDTTTENTSEERSTRSTRASRRSHQRQTPESNQQVPEKKMVSKNKPKKKTAVAKSKKRIKPSKATQKRRSSRLKRSTSALSEDRTKKSTTQKPIQSSDDYGSPKKAKSNTRRASTAISDDSDTELSLRKKSKKVRFMEAHGLKDSQEVPKSKSNEINLNSSTPSTKSKRVTFAEPVDITLTKKIDPSSVIPSKKVDVNGVTPSKKEKDPAEEYKKAISAYLLDVDSYKKKLTSWFECLCCDRKFHLLEQCQAHVRGHFPGALTN